MSQESLRIASTVSMRRKAAYATNKQMLQLAYMTERTHIPVINAVVGWIFFAQTFGIYVFRINIWYKYFQ